MHCDCIFAFTRKNDAFVAKIVNTRLTKIFMTIFVPNQRLPSSAILLKGWVIEKKVSKGWVIEW